jgi:hypothetical protein
MVARLAAALVLLIRHGGVDGCSRLQISNCSVSAVPWWNGRERFLCGLCQWRRCWLWSCGGPLPKPWWCGWWRRPSLALRPARMMRVKTHPFFGRHQWRFLCHFLPEGDVGHLWRVARPLRGLRCYRASPAWCFVVGGLCESSFFLLFPLCFPSS